ncbi:hypothetical protein F7734_12995 [Scytonema sp. UIC 10036]|uniref:hypothetical protein n=1 Tax=Scytonema sp. UIC 10036 TaxID=2304196 RepID=UPI0012DA8D02|nr:hypothetical protein [Scytonema sp. UIC 10036]MUG93295.1 hypothetical protein [Scytonema sp. UIC 10036]
MSQTLVNQESTIIFAIKENNPATLTEDLLKYIGAVPKEWQAARPPICSNSVSQVMFTSGVGVVSEPNRVLIIETIAGKAAAEISCPSVAKKYVETLSNVEYQAVSINHRGYVAFEREQDAASKYMAQTLLSPGTWQEVGNAPMRATLNLAYSLDRCPLYLSITEAALRFPDETTTPIVMFSSSFRYEIAGGTAPERLSHLHQAIDNWQTDLSTYQDIINTKFLARASENSAVVPSLFAMSA